MEFHELAPEQQAKIKGDHPEFESYAPGRKAAVVRDRLKKDKRNTKLTAGKAEEVKSSLNIDANPVGYHKALYKSNDALETAANDHPNQDAMRSVFSHTDQARSSLAAHWDAHHAGNVEEAAGHLRSAAGHISNAAMSYHIVAGIPGGTDEISKHVKNVADGYKYNVAGGKAPQVKQARPDTYLSEKADAGLKKQTIKDEKGKKAWERYAKKADMKLPPVIQRTTPEEKATEYSNKLGLNRQIRAAGGSVSEGLEDKRFNTPDAPSVTAKDTRSGVQKYTGTLATYGRNSKVVVPPENRADFEHHAGIAKGALRMGQPVPEETKVALGRVGMDAVHKSHNTWLANTTSGEESTRGGRGGSTSDFEAGRG